MRAQHARDWAGHHENWSELETRRLTPQIFDRPARPAVRPLRTRSGTRVRPKLAELPDVAIVSAGFSRFWALSGPPACLRERGPCGKNRPPAGAFKADSLIPGMLP